ncbi:MAG: Gfo/Idh/MocA family oxidoreductase [Armatimonadota bacterium]|nr:Gfo/Idh/MocA family oxidoreductase [Armatimonadota bacterium]
MSKGISRRSFIKGAAVGGFSFVFLRDSRTAFGFEANEKLNVGVIGCGGQGRGNMNACAGENIVALCDVNENTMREAAKKYPKAKLFPDFRRMLDKMGGEIDAVTVSTPDHTHAPAAVMAMRMGKHVYCEKPLTYSIYEARLMRDLAREHKLATQMGNQGTSSNGLREAVEVVRSGALGQVYEVHVWSDRPIWPQGVDRPIETQPTPSDLHWDLWLGPAPERPYNEAYAPFRWRGWLDFGTGALGDMGCHTANMPFMALDLKNPMSVEAEVFEMTGETYPKQSIVTYLFPARGDRRTVRMKWYDGGLKPPADRVLDRKLPGNGFVIIGDKGRLFSGDAYGGGYKLTPDEDFANFKAPEPTLPRSPGHHEEWLLACKGGAPPMSNFDYASGLTETILLGNLAIVTGERINWDAENMKAINCPKADCHISRPYRKGWTL